MRRDRIAIYITLFLSFFAETALFDKLHIFGIRPELLVIATLFFGFHFGPACGIEVGIVSGILKDLFSITLFGINTFSFMLLGLFSGYLKKKLFKNNFITQFLLANLFVYLISAVYLIYLKEILVSDIGNEFWKRTLYKGIYTGFFAPFLFVIFVDIFKSKET